jgi:CheY-like chemotaxis protein
MPAIRILCVDDDLRILEMLPKVLTLSGYEVVSASNVPEALNIITSQKFDVLISDLNMGHVADGFTVVHTMRRVNPNCVNFILTGYPAFESALQALREQVDDYLVKPSDIPKLLAAIEKKLKERKPAVQYPNQRLSAILRDNMEAITARILDNMKVDAKLSALPLSDAERLDHIPQMLTELADHMDSGLPNDANENLLRAARARGEERSLQRYPLDLLILNERIIMEVVCNFIYENLLGVNLSYLLLDLQKLHDARMMQLEETIVVYLKVERRRETPGISDSAHGA